MNDTGKIEVNVEEIMRNIRKEIQMEEEEERLPSFESIPLRGETVQVQGEKLDWPLFLESLSYVNLNYDIPYYWSFGPKSIRTFIKRVVRKLAKCILLPILFKQNLLNAHFVRCLNQIRFYIEKTDLLFEQNTQKIEGLKSELQGQKDEISCVMNCYADRYKKIYEEMQSLRRNLAEQTEELQKQSEYSLELKASLDEKDFKLKQQKNRIAEIEQKFSDIKLQFEEAQKGFERSKNLLTWLKDNNIYTEQQEGENLSSFSQSGEDMILSYILRKEGIDESSCTYLDLGANHAKDLSNT